MKDTRKYKHTELGLLPEDWEVAKLGEKFRFISNNTFSRDFLCEDGEIKNIHYGDVLIKYGSTLDISQSDIPAINTEILPSYQPKCFAEDGDIIIADTAEDETVCKTTELWNIGGKRVVAGLHTMWCRPAQNTFAIKFLGYFMNTSLYHNQVLPLIQGIKVSSVSKSAIQGTWLCIPPIKEQRRIASALSSIDDLIDSLDKLISKKRDIKQGAMQQLLSGKKRLKGFTEPWVEKKLGDVALFKAGKTLSKGTLQEHGNYPCYGGNGIRTYLPIYSHDGEYSIVGRQGELCGNVVYAIGKFYATEHALVVYPYEIANSRFIYYLLIMLDLNQYSKGCAQPGLSVETINSVETILPSSLPEQQAVAAVLTSMDNELSALEAKRKKYEQIKQGMMQQLLTGKIRLENASMVH